METGDESSAAGNTRTTELSIQRLQQEHHTRTDPNAGMPVVLGPPQIARYGELLTKGTLPACVQAT
jgi:hypothetical protein